MFLNKRISKFRSAPTLLSQESSENTPPSIKAQKAARCRFKQIPQNTKFVIGDPMYPLIGDIPLRGSESGLSMDISLYNHFKLYRHITVNEFFGEKLIMIRPTPKNDKTLNSQLAVIDRLDEIQSFGGDEWTNTIRTFYQKYDKVMKRQTRKKTKCDVRKKFYVKITAKTVEKKKELFQKYPCIELQFRLRNHQSQLNQVNFSYRFIRELGYSEESFISTVLTEGIPQVTASDAPFSSEIKMLINNYFQIDNNGFEAPENQATLLLKSGYVNDIKYQVHVLMNYETNTFGMDLILAIVSKEEPYLPKQKNLEDKLNENFIWEMIARESEAEYFFSKFYNESIQRKYTDMGKVCQIKEIASVKCV